MEIKAEGLQVEDFSLFSFLQLRLDQNDIHDETKSRFHSGNARYNSVQNLFCLPVSYQINYRLKYTKL
jgi:hypothetical protein